MTTTVFQCFTQRYKTGERGVFEMESFATIANTTQFAHLVKEETKKTQHVNTTCLTQCALNTSLHNVYNTNNVYEMIPAREYGLLLKQLEEWGVAYPKAVCKKHGVRTVQRAVAYVKGTPNVKSPGAYFTYMVRQLKPVEEAKQETASVKKEEKQDNNVEATKMPQNERKMKKGLLTTLPEIKDWKEANKFLWELENYDLNNENVIEFVRKIKKEYNFA